jgi:uncharacterized protein (DUF1778 family)
VTRRRVRLKADDYLASPGNLPYNERATRAISVHFMETGMAATQTTAKTKERPQRLEARVPADVKMVIQHAANISGRSLSDFVMTSALKAAQETIREHEVIVLTTRDSIAFAEALLNPKGPNEALVAAARRHRELLGPYEGD